VSSLTSLPCVSKRLFDMSGRDRVDAAEQQTFPEVAEGPEGAIAITDRNSVGGDRKLKESTLRFARGGPQPSAVGFDDRAADR
jgi:hypothetical protein